MKLTRSAVLRFACTAFFLILTCCMLTNSNLSLYYALTGLTLWYTKMIPALLPFMILSGVMVRMKLTEDFTTLLYPLLNPFFRIRRNVCYVMIMGFLCGFPMGAKCVNDLYARGMITKREANYLLAFCNNIGPIYFCSFVLPLLERKRILPYVFGMYALPLLYGLILRYTQYRDIGGGEISADACRFDERENLIPSPLKALDDSIYSSMQSILMLGGYMILFNLLNLLPHLATGRIPRLLAPLLEITGGLSMLGTRKPLYSLLVLPFGGLSCIAQTYSCIKESALGIGGYIRHKLILTAVTILYYAAWYFLKPAAFLL